MNMHNNPQATVTMTKEEASAVERIIESSVNLQRNMEKVQQQFSTLSTQFSAVLSRLEKLEGKQPPPLKKNDSYPKAWDDYDNGALDKRFS